MHNFSCVCVVVELDSGDKIYLKSFPSSKIIDFIDFIKTHNLINVNLPQNTILHATGGGAYKYADLFEKEFEGKVKIQKLDEMSSLVHGMSFVLNNAKSPSYTYREGEGKKLQTKETQQVEEDVQSDSSSLSSLF